MRLNINKLPLILSLLSIIVFSCGKDDFNSSKNNTIPKFASNKDFSNTTSEVVEMTPEELKDFEKEKGFSSFGRMSEDFYQKIDFESFKTTDELKAFVQKNGNYLQFIEDDNGELELETKFHNRADRYLQNADNMYQIGETVYKVFEYGTVSSSIDNLELFYKKGNNLDSFKKDDKFSFYSSENDNVRMKSTTSNCTPTEPFRSTEGRERLKVELEVSTNYGQTEVTYHFLSRPYKMTLGIWFWVSSRNMYADVDVDWHYVDFQNADVGGGQTSILVTKTSSFYHNWVHVSKYEQTITEAGSWIMNDNGMEPGISRYDINCDTDDVDAIVKTCE
jgi:hypothetical protein